MNIFEVFKPLRLSPRVSVGLLILRLVAGLAFIFHGYGKITKPFGWIPELLSLKTRVEEATPGVAYSNSGWPTLGYNAVLCNLYRNGKDSVGLHADAEPEMGPVIASVSLGAERLFRLKEQNGAVAFAERLPQGSLLIMGGKTQKNFKHGTPKSQTLLRHALT